MLHQCTSTLNHASNEGTDSRKTSLPATITVERTTRMTIRFSFHHERDSLTSTTKAFKTACCTYLYGSYLLSRSSAAPCVRLTFAVFGLCSAAPSRTCVAYRVFTSMDLKGHYSESHQVCIIVCFVRSSYSTVANLTTMNSFCLFSCYGTLCTIL
jgi:hypothetical protein